MMYAVEFVLKQKSTILFCIFFSSSVRISFQEFSINQSDQSKWREPVNCIHVNSNIRQAHKYTHTHTPRRREEERERET